MPLLSRWLIKRKLLSTWAVWLVVCASCATNSSAALAEPYAQFVQREALSGHFQPAIEAWLFAKANALRQSKGLPALKADQAMSTAARAHAEDMATSGRLGHVSSSGLDFDSRMRALRAGALVLPAMGENAAAVTAQASAAETAQSLFKAWLASPPHLHTLLSRDYLKVSTGVSIVNGKAYADQIFTGPEVMTNMMRAQ